MSEPTTEAADSSPAIEVERGALVTWTPEQRTEFRKTGNMPGQTKEVVEEPSPSDTEKDPAAESDASPAKTQEHANGKPKTEKRFQELLEERKTFKSERDALKAELEALKSEPSRQARPEPPPQPVTRPKPTAEDSNPDGTPKYKTYEDFVEDLADWKAEQRWTTQQREAAQREQAREMKAKVDEARTRYENFDDVLQPTLTAIVGDNDISPSIKAMLNDSDVLPDLIFTLGSNKEDLQTFLSLAKNNPGKALRYIALTESLINEELSGKAKSESHDPVKPRTSAPKPPAEVGGRATAPGDALESAAQSGDFRAFKAEANRRYLAKLKG